MCRAANGPGGVVLGPPRVWAGAGPVDRSPWREMPSLTLATWNVAQPKSPRSREALRACTDAACADVLVLTETRDDLNPGHAHVHSSAPGMDGLDSDQARWVSIWSRFALEPLRTSDPQRTCAARVTPDGAPPFVVFGTVLPWLGSPWRDHPAAGGEAFREALSLQAADWTRLSAEFPGDEFFVLGDFNQDLVAEPPHYYGSTANRKALKQALAEAGLVALTAGPLDPVRRDSPPCASIDHICARQHSKWRPAPAVRWPEAPKPPRSLSDHFGVSITFERD